eukprot:1467600-Lingulodinium_polyedra.AAC.1
MAPPRATTGHTAPGNTIPQHTTYHNATYHDISEHTPYHVARRTPRHNIYRINGHIIHRA